jgi:hypothetical protein
LLSCCFLASSPLSHPFVSQFSFPPGSPSSSFFFLLLRPRCPRKQERKIPKEWVKKEGRKESKERKRQGMGEKERNHQNRKEAKESDEERKDKRKSLCFLQAFLPFFPSLLFPSLLCFLEKLSSNTRGGKKNKTATTTTTTTLVLVLPSLS